jgi:hypothetical protein
VPCSGATKGGWRGLEHPPEQNWGALQFVQIRRLFLEGGWGVARVGHTEWHTSVIIVHSQTNKILLLKLFLSCKMHQNSFGGRAPPGPAGEAHSAPPDPPAEYGGGRFAAGRGGEEEREDGEGKARGRLKRRETREGEREGRGREGKGHREGRDRKVGEGRGRERMG